MQYQIQYWLQYCNIILFRYCNIVMLHIGFQYDGILLRIGYNIVMHRIADEVRLHEPLGAQELHVASRGALGPVAGLQVEDDLEPALATDARMA